MTALPLLLESTLAVMAGLVAVVHVFARSTSDEDNRNDSRHDGSVVDSTILKHALMP